ncbi:MAG: ACP S-malonyltransferase [Parachlamydiales bacterium]|jgi:[acyl-carrier-protein] S-malonyltransferase
MNKRYVFIFPGQGAQYVGMGKDFIQEFPIVRQTMEEANDLLGKDIQKIILEGPEELLTETANSQVAIYILSLAYLRALKQLAPHLTPTFTAGLSLGEYTALTAAGYLPFEQGLALVHLRGQAMNDACAQNPGTMAVVLGLNASQVEEAVRETALPHDLWAANFNSPGQIVISGTLKGIEAGTAVLTRKGAKRILPLKVHGAFHSGLMSSAAARLKEAIAETQWKQGSIPVAMNTTGRLSENLEEIKQLLTEQVTSPVRWEQSILTLEEQGVDAYIEIGCGKALSGFNKRIGVKAPTYSIEKTTDLAGLEELFATRN